MMKVEKYFVVSKRKRFQEEYEIAFFSLLFDLELQFKGELKCTVSLPSR